MSAEEVVAVSIAATCAAFLVASCMIWARCGRLCGGVRRAFSLFGRRAGVSAAARDRLRLELFARGQHGRRAYHVAPDGKLLVCRAEDFYAALFAGVEDFWQLVAVYGGDRHVFARPVSELKPGDGKGRLSRVDCVCGITYVDAVFPDELPHAYLCRRASAEDIAKEVDDAQRESADGGHGDGDV